MLDLNFTRHTGSMNETLRKQKLKHFDGLEDKEIASVAPLKEAFVRQLVAHAHNMSVESDENRSPKRKEQLSLLMV